MKRGYESDYDDEESDYDDDGDEDEVLPVDKSWKSWTISNFVDGSALTMPMTGLVDQEPSVDLRIPGNVNVFLLDVPPHMAKMEGNLCENVVMNLRHAVEIGDEETTNVCLRLLFNLFVDCQDVQIMVLTAGDREERLAQLPSLSCFSNLNALYMHQFIYDTIMTIFFEQVGVSTPTAFLQLSRLWSKYEYHLYRWDISLAYLLEMGTLLCRCYKNGHIFFMHRFFSERSKERYTRSEMLANPYLVSKSMIDHDSFLKCIELLEKPDRWYPSDERTRLTMFMECFLADPQIKYLEQAKFLSPKHLTKYINDTILPHVSLYTETMRGKEEEVGMLRDLVFRLAHVCLYSYSQINYLLGNRRSHLMQRRILTMLHALVELISTPAIKQLGRNGIFAMSSRHVASMMPTIMPVFAQEIYLQGKGHLLPYGIIGNDPHVRVGAKKKIKNNGIDPVVTGQQTIPTKPRTQAEALHPSMMVAADGNVVMISSFRRVNRPVETTLAYSRQLWEMGHKWKRIKKQSKTATRPPRIMDYIVFDTKNMKVLAPGVFKVKIRPSAYDMLGFDPTSVTTSKRHQPFVLPEFASSEDRGLYLEHFTRFDVNVNPTPCDAIVRGPYPDSTEDRLTKRWESLQQVKKKLSLDSMFSTMIRLVVHDFPASPETEPNRPALFLIDIPHQYGTGARTYREHNTFMQNKGVVQAKNLSHHLMKSNYLANMVAYLRHKAGSRDHGDLFSILYAYLEYEPVGETGLCVVSTRLTLVVDDMCEGIMCATVQAKLQSLVDRLTSFDKNTHKNLEQAIKAIP